MPQDPLLAAFDRLVRREPAAALVASPRRTASRAEVDATATALCERLRGAGAAPGEMVLLAAANGTGFLGALVGCRRAGLVPVLADCTSPSPERERIRRAIGIRWTVSCAVEFPDAAEGVAVERSTPGEAAPAPRGTGYVKLTSGSAGEPAGVAVSAEGLCADDDQLAVSMGLLAPGRFLASIPWSHSYGLASLVLPALRRGSLLVIPDSGGPWSPIDAAHACGATVFPTVPALVGAIASLPVRPPWPGSLRTVITAGATLPAETAARFRSAFGLPVHVLYGATECGGIAYDREGGAAERGTVGTPVDGVAVELRDSGTPREGLVVVRSPAVGTMYLPEASPRLAGGIFRSTDIATWASDGSLRLLGRADAVINTGGKKVHPGEVEAVLRAMPGVRDAAVFGVPSSSGDREIVRAVVACEPGRLDYTAVSGWCRSRLARHKVPRSIALVEELPRTARGKLDRSALAAIAPGPAPAAE